MTNDLGRAIFDEAHAAEDKEEFYATLLGVISAFCAEHLGDARAELLFVLGARTIAETEHETLQ